VKRRRLLVLSPWFPYPADNGSRLRAFFLLRELSKAFAVSLVTGVQEDSPDGIPEPLAALCEEIIRVPWCWHDGGQATGVAEMLRALVSPVPRSVLETPNPPLIEAIAAEVARRPDAVLVMELGMDAYVPRAAFGLPIVLDQAEVSGMERAYRTAEGWKSRLRHRMTWEKSAAYWGARLRRYRVVTAVSEAEAEAIRRLTPGGPPDVRVVPNGTDVQAYSRPEAGKRVRGRLLYNGALTYGPNRDAVRWFSQEILPKVTAHVPEAYLLVTGRYGTEDTAGIAGLDDGRVRLTGFVPDLRPVLAGAAVCVVPLLAGGGTRLKILEAWAAGVPVVSTTVGAAGLNGEDGMHLLLRDDPSGFADAVADLLNDPERAERMAANARRLAEERYDWAAVGAKLITSLEDAISVGGLTTVGSAAGVRTATAPDPGTR
jgi:glycosyltransferase involved in cell wall biosynthesis